MQGTMEQTLSEARIYEERTAPYCSSKSSFMFWAIFSKIDFVCDFSAINRFLGRNRDWKKNRQRYPTSFSIISRLIRTSHRSGNRSLHSANCSIVLRFISWPDPSKHQAAHIRAESMLRRLLPTLGFHLCAELSFADATTVAPESRKVLNPPLIHACSGASYSSEKWTTDRKTIVSDRTTCPPLTVLCLFPCKIDSFVACFAW